MKRRDGSFYKFSSLFLLSEVHVLCYQCKLAVFRKEFGEPLMSYYDDRDLKGLLANLDNARYLALSALADWESEHEEEWRAKAWMWLRDHKKWPSKRRDTYRRCSTNEKRVYGWNFVIHKTPEGATDWSMKGFIKAHLKGPANIPKVALLPRESPSSINYNYMESDALLGIIPNVVKWLKLLESYGLNDFELHD